MSWGEVVKINNNMKYSINEQIRNNRFLPAHIITQSTNFTPEKSGYYKVICVGAGGNSGTYVYRNSITLLSGGAGGVAIKTYQLSSTSSYGITFSDGSSTFNNELTAGKGSSVSLDNPGTGGNAVGGNINFIGNNGNSHTVAETVTASLAGASVGCYIPELSQTYSYMNETFSGYGICGLGYSGGIAHINEISHIQQPGGAGCIIIPLEYDE